MKATEAVVWIIALMVVRQHPYDMKLAVHEFQTQAECEAAVPYIKRYYRLYGKRWTASCSKTVKKPQQAATN